MKDKTSPFERSSKDYSWEFRYIDLEIGRNQSKILRGCSCTWIEVSLKYTRSWRKNHIRNSFKKIAEEILRSHKLIGLMHVRPFILVFFWWLTF